MGSRIPAPDPPRHPGPQPGPPGRRRGLDLVAVLGQELPPHLHVTVLDRGQLPVQRGLALVPLGLGQLAVQERGVGLVLQVVEPDVRGGGDGGMGDI